jgi:hypothetical protein
VKYQNEKAPNAAPQTNQPPSGPTRTVSKNLNDQRNYHSQPARAEKKSVPTLQEITRQSPQRGLVGGLAKTVGTGVSDVAEVMTQNFAALAVRKEKLDELLVSSEQLANRSSAFASIANDLAEKESGRKWWQ